ncbi:DUF3173 domain-containing protein [Streptococcus iniae]|uniref:DUF3173 family protein n=1 Tax=Streptococcus iniae TaxID=1346 RepID=UPI0003732AD4|nr:DUF3173 family protein [Streptococcus iniae]ESR10129.1 hypothetical protein IUSA1_03145 [Streptococcus iniae IUSA1]KYJ82899.1 hypothetical protein NA30_01275 [Streptococcus iniae]RLV28643.1 DUF3173 domain-containing protein [Streptococcus iniae]RMI76831.1 DUF3173 domain-containing protein [Streptococcus iniae]HEK4517152.1 DUF3173 family protein [Streptococcus iniae]
MRATVNKQDLLKEMSEYHATQVMKMAKQKLVEDGFLIYDRKRNIEIPQEYIYKVLGRKIENG